MTDDDLLKLTIEGTGTSIKRNINQDQFARIVLLLAKPISSINFGEEQTPSDISQKSIREFLNEKSATSNPQKIVVIAAYLESKDYKSITAPVFKQHFESAAEPVPKNITRDIKEAIRLGWLAESFKQDGSYFITESGKAKIQTGFSAEPDITVKRKRGSSGKRTFKPVNVRPEVQKIDISSESRGMKNYWDLNKGERILWICAQLNKSGFSKLNFKEISYFANKLGDNIGQNSISGLIGVHRKANRATTPLDDGGRQVQILKPGIDLVTISNKGEMPEGSNGSVS